MDVTQLALGGQTVKNLRRLACKFDLDQSERKSSQVNANARKPWPCKRSHKLTQVFNLGQLTSPFGQGLNCAGYCLRHRPHERFENAAYSLFNSYACLPH